MEVCTVGCHGNVMGCQGHYRVAMTLQNETAHWVPCTRGLGVGTALPYSRGKGLGIVRIRSALEIALPPALLVGRVP